MLWSFAYILTLLLRLTHANDIKVLNVSTPVNGLSNVFEITSTPHTNAISNLRSDDSQSPTSTISDSVSFMSDDDLLDSSISKGTSVPLNSSSSRWTLSHENPDSKKHTSSFSDSSYSMPNADESCKFVSFEEWKKLKQAEHAEHKSESTASVNTSTKALLTESNKTPTNLQSNSTIPNPASVEDQGKTYKDKFNYASVNCAATVVKTNSEAKGASAILTEVKDSYLINKCSSLNKFVVIELCQDILINTVVIGNYELFSSMFKDLKFLVSDRFPVVDGWRELGQYQAQNIRDVQSFDIKNPLIWARYLKIEILSHYGNEFYCPISLVRVHGTTMMEEVKNTDHTTDKEAFKEPESPTQALLNYTEDLEPEECKARLPHLVLNDFLTELNTTKQYCDLKDSNSTSSPAEVTNSIATQESIFQNIIKRLSLLESNSTLSLLYFEEQSKLLSEAFSNLEKRQSKRFESFALRVNSSIIMQGYIIEKRLKSEFQRLFDGFKNSTEVTSNEKIFMLARELSLQRKIIVVDTVIIIFLLAYMTLTRETKVVETGIKKTDIKAFPVASKKMKTRRKKREH